MRRICMFEPPLWLVVLLSTIGVVHSRADDGPWQGNPPKTNALWDAHFQKGATEFDISAGAGYGMLILGTEEHHHWGMGMLEYGWMITDASASADRWYHGNWEVLLDVLGGGQYHPDTAYFGGMGPEVRYNFVTGTRLVPFVNAGAGVTATDIRNGDLSTTFEFNLHAGAGVHCFISDNAAITGQCRLIHLSNAGMDTPNQGVNNLTLMLGASFWW